MFITNVDYTRAININHLVEISIIMTNYSFKLIGILSDGRPSIIIAEGEEKEIQKKFNILLKMLDNNGKK